MAQIIQFKPNTKQPEKPIQNETTNPIVIPQEIAKMLLPGFVHMTLEVVDVINIINQDEYDNDIDNGPFAA